MAFTVLEPESKDKGFTVIEPEKKGNYTVLQPESAIQKMNPTDFGSQGREQPNAQPMNLWQLLNASFAQIPRPTPRSASDSLRMLFGRGAAGGVDLTRLLPPPPTDTQLTNNPISNVTLGAERAAGDMGQFFMTPLGVMTLGAGSLPKVAQRLVAGGFAAQMASQVPGQIKETYKAAKQGDVAGVTEGGVNTMLNALLAQQGAKAALHETPIAPQPTMPDARTQMPGEGAASLQQVLQSIAANKGSSMASVAEKLTSAPRSTEMMNKNMVVNPQLTKAGAFDPASQTAEIHPKMTDNDFVKLHEIAHAMTERRLKDPRFNQEVTQLYNEAKGVLPADLHGMKNVDEFVAEAVTNPGFRQQLKFTRSGQRSMLDKVVDLTYSMVGRAREKGSMLQRAEGTIDPILNTPSEPLQLNRSTEPRFVGGEGGVEDLQQPKYNKPMVKNPLKPERPVTDTFSIEVYRGQVDESPIDLKPDVESGVPSIFFSDSKDNALNYSKEEPENPKSKGGKVYSVKLEPKNPLIVDAKGKNWNEVQDLKSAKNAGHDVVIFKNVGDNAHPNDDRLTTSYAVLDKSVIKTIGGDNSKLSSGAPLPGDYDRFKELETKVTDLIGQARKDPTKMVELLGQTDVMRKEMEEIKNRQPKKGMPPERFSSGVNLPAPEKLFSGLSLEKALKDESFRKQFGNHFVYWLDSNGLFHKGASHVEIAENILKGEKKYIPKEENETEDAYVLRIHKQMRQDKFLRVVSANNGIYIEPSEKPITPSQWRELKDYAIEKNQTITDDNGKVVFSPSENGLFSGFPLEERKKVIFSSPKANPLALSQRIINQPGESLTIPDVIRNKIAPIINTAKKADRMVNPIDVIYDWLDGGKAKYDGVLMNNIRKPLDDKFNDALNLETSSAEPIRKLIKAGKIGLRESERIDVYLKAIQEGGRKRMIDSGVKPGVIDRIMTSLTKEEMAVANKMREFYDKSYAEIARVAKSADDIKVKQVKNYSPWHRDWGKYNPEADMLAGNPKLKDTKLGTKEVEVDDVLWPGLEEDKQGRQIPGSTIARKPGAQTPIKLDAVGTFERYVRDYSHYVSMRELLKESASIVRDPEFAKTYGDLGQKLVMENLNTIARQGRYKRNAFFDALRRTVGRGVIAYRLPSQLVHLANIPLAMERTGVVWWERGREEVFTEEGQKFLHKHFAETFARGGGEPALAEIAEQHARTKAGQAYNKFSNAGFAAQRWIDMLSAQSTVMGIYMRKLKEKGLDYNNYHSIPVDKAAIQDARVLARRAVASPLYKDVPPVLTKGGTWSRSLLQFQNTFLDQWSNIRYDLIQNGIPQVFTGNPKLAFRMMVALSAMLLVETSVKHGYKQALTSGTGGKMKEDDTFELALGKEALRRIPGLGQLQSELIYGETGIPSVDAAMEPVRQGIKYAKSDDKAGKTIAATKAGAAVSESLGVPGSSQLSDIIVGKERSSFYKPHNERLKEEAGKDVDKMTLKERLDAEMKHKDTQENLSPTAKARAAEQAVAANVKRGEALHKDLSRADRGWLESRGLALPGYDNKVNFTKDDTGYDKAVSVSLSEKEMKRYHELILERYNLAIKVLRKEYEGLDRSEKAEFYKGLMSEAKKEAREKLKEEMSDSESELHKEKKPKRFSIFND